MVGVTHHRVLWSPDFPLSGEPGPLALAAGHATVQPTRGIHFIPIKLINQDLIW